MNNGLYKKGLVVVLIVALLIMAAMGIKLSSKEQEVIFTGFEDEINLNMDNSNSSEDQDMIILVDIDGAVINPGVYELHKGQRVNDAIIMAGGLKENAYTKNLNKARKLIDGEKIYILTNEETENEINDESGNAETVSNLININTASLNELMTLPGIGQVYAQRIIDYRSSKAFGSIDEIKNIQGIGDKTFDKLKNLIATN